MDEVSVRSNLSKFDHISTDASPATDLTHGHTRM